MKKLNIYFASYYLHYSFHCIPRISFNRGNNPKYIYNQNISITRRENNTKWIKSPSSRLFQPLHKILGTSYMTNRLISGVGLLRRPFIRLSALDCPICSFCPQRAANSTNSITPVSRVLDRRPCSPPRRELSPPRRLWGGARSAARRGWWWGVAATPTRRFSVANLLRHAPKNRIVDARIACSRVRTCELTSGTNPRELWLGTIYKARKRKCRFFPQRFAAPSKSIDLFRFVQFRFTETAFEKLCERNTSDISDIDENF